jgi:hypothetical protein
VKIKSSFINISYIEYCEIKPNQVMVFSRVLPPRRTSLRECTIISGPANRTVIFE